MHPYAKFSILTVVIVGAISFLMKDGVTETKSYYKTIEEVGKMGNDAQVKRLKVAGDVDNIEKMGQGVKFRILQKEKGKEFAMDVLYTGKDPLPDTFRVGAQALADGKLGSDGVFHATQVQAKCASKYETKPEMKGGHMPINATPAKI